MDSGDAKRTRGRPRSDADPYIARCHASIARTVWQLMVWGYDLRTQVCPAVARLSATILKVEKAVGGPLSPHRIEQIYKTWHSTSQGGWVKDGTRLPLPRPWSSESKDYAQAGRPRQVPFSELVAILLGNGGIWPKNKARPRHLGDPELTAKYQALLERYAVPKLLPDDTPDSEDATKPGS